MSNRDRHWRISISRDRRVRTRVQITPCKVQIIVPSRGRWLVKCLNFWRFTFGRSSSESIRSAINDPVFGPGKWAGKKFTGAKMGFYLPHHLWSGVIQTRKDPVQTHPCGKAKIGVMFPWLVLSVFTSISVCVSSVWYKWKFCLFQIIYPDQITFTTRVRPFLFLYQPLQHIAIYAMFF